MTGYGSAEIVTDRYTIKVEIKSLNSKFLDLITKVPKEFQDREIEIKTLLTNELSRGKINFLLELESTLIEDKAFLVNEELFNYYFQAFATLSKKVGAENSEYFSLALQSPNVIEAKEDFMEMVDWNDAKKVIKDAINACNQFRKDEGIQLAKSLEENISNIRNGLLHIVQLDPGRQEHLRKRLDQNIAEIKDRIKVDSNRFEQELIYYLEKLDITEEKVRLQSHLDYFEQVMGEATSNGKKLGFISQEMGREINTIGSKANDAEMQKTVVGMKDALEQIKEQILNVV